MLSFNFIFYSLYILFKCPLYPGAPKSYLLLRTCAILWFFKCKVSILCHVLSPFTVYPLSNINQRHRNRKRRNQKSRLEITHLLCVSLTDLRRVRLLLSINNDNFCKILCSVQKEERGKKQQHEVAPCWSKNQLYVHIYILFRFCCRCKRCENRVIREPPVSKHRKESKSKQAKIQEHQRSLWG